MYKQCMAIIIINLIFGWLTFAAAQEEAPVEEAVVDDSTERCISIRSIRSTDIIDDRNILFHMRNRIVYHNTLNHRCNGLAREDRMTYQASSGRLCSNDSISVLHRGALGIRKGISCGLGVFYKLTREDAEALKEGANERPPGKPLPMPGPQEVGEEQQDPE